MEVRITRDEVYPVYEISDKEWASPIEADAETVERWKQTQAAWDLMQVEIQAAASKNPDYFDGKYWHI